MLALLRSTIPALFLQLLLFLCYIRGEFVDLKCVQIHTRGCDVCNHYFMDCSNVHPESNPEKNDDESVAFLSK